MWPQLVSQFPILFQLARSYHHHAWQHPLLQAKDRQRTKLTIGIIHNILSIKQDDGYQNTPAQLNELADVLWPSFQLSQPIPVPAYNCELFCSMLLP